MATKKYCAFWYPSIFHQTGLDVVDCPSEIDHKDISDYIGKSSFRLYLNIKEASNGDLTFATYTIGPNRKDRNVNSTLFLKKEAESKNGFVVYSYEDDIDFEDYIYSSTFYHYAKQLHHSHEINHDSDSGLRAMSDNTVEFFPREIFKQDNAVLRFYLKQYESIFAIHYAKHLSSRSAFYEKFVMVLDKFHDYLSRNNVISFGEEDVRNLEKSINIIVVEINKIDRELIGESYSFSEVHGLKQCRRAMKKLLQRRGIICHFLVQNILQICDNAEIEYTYCKTLLESKYNTEAKHNIKFSEDDVEALSQRDYAEIDSLLLRKDHSRKMANNIRNAMRYVECIRNKCLSRRYDMVDSVIEASDQLTKKAYVLSWVFGVVTLISLVVAIVSTFR